VQEPAIRRLDNGAGGKRLLIKRAKGKTSAANTFEGINHTHGASSLLNREKTDSYFFSDRDIARGGSLVRFLEEKPECGGRTLRQTEEG